MLYRERKSDAYKSYARSHGVDAKAMSEHAG